MKNASIVLPTFNEQEGIERFYEELTNTTNQLSKKYSFEFIFINDGSTDKTRSLLNRIQQKDRKVTIINFTKNFGHQSAISAGLAYAKGNFVITMDTDLQDPPKIIFEMIAKYERGFDVVHGVRTDRKDSFFKKFSAFVFYKLFRILSGYKAIENTADFKLIDKVVQNELNSNPSSKSFLRGSIARYGDRQGKVYYIRPERIAGKSKYSLKKMIGLALDGFKFAINPKLLKPPQYEIEEIIENQNI
jgi:polyisoprenyl-phosphate glycosyltransferase